MESDTVSMSVDFPMNAERYAEVKSHVRNRSGWYWDRFRVWREHGYGYVDAVKLTAGQFQYDQVRTMQSLAEQLAENTGRHMLDSGGAYGRHWERNAGMDWQAFHARPRVSTYAYTGDNEPDEHGRTQVRDLEITLDVFHVLADALDYSPEMDERFARWGASRDESWLESADAWLEHIDADGPYWSNGPTCINTCNGEHATSQVLQYWVFEHENTAYVLLSTHNGCDVRDGYSRPRVYECDHETAMDLSGARFSAYAPAPDSDPNQLDLIPDCDPVDYAWDTQDAGYSFDDSGCAYPAETPEFDVDDVSVDEDGQLYWTHPESGEVRRLEFDFFMGH